MKNGFTYILVQRTDKKALYSQFYNNVQVGYEVFFIKVRGNQFSQLLNKPIDASERFPSNEVFGKTAWSFTDFQKALQKYQELE
jgi:hypothetical protein